MTSQPSSPSPAHLRGAVDLSSLASPRPAGAPSGTAAGGAEGSWVIPDADQQLFPQLVQLSAQVPVLLHLHVPGDAASEALYTQFADAVDAQAGRLVLARFDVAAEPSLLQALGLAAGPAVMAVVAGQPVPLVNQAVPAETLAQLMGEILEVARQNGVAGTVPPVGPPRADAGGTPASAAPPVPPLHRAAQEALAADDLPGAEAAWERALAENPADVVAQQGLAATRLMARTRDADAAAVRTAGADAPDDAAAQIAVADLDVLGGHAEDAFARLVRFIAAHRGEEREAVRAHLVELYTVVGMEDPRVQASRRRLAAALY